MLLKGSFNILFLHLVLIRISEIIMKMIVLFDDSNQDCVINGGRDCNGRSAFVRQFHSSLMSIPVLSGCLNKMG